MTIAEIVCRGKRWKGRLSVTSHGRGNLLDESVGVNLIWEIKNGWREIKQKGRNAEKNENEKERERELPVFIILFLSFLSSSLFLMRSFFPVAVNTESSVCP